MNEYGETYFEGYYENRMDMKSHDRAWSESLAYRRIVEEQKEYFANIRRKELEKKKAKYPPIGTKIHIIHMIGEPDYDGREGIITSIGDDLQFEGTWGVATLMPEQDTWKIVP